MTLLPQFLFVLLSALTFALGEDLPALYTIEGTIVPNPVMSDIPPTMRVTLDGGLYTGYVREDGHFVIHKVPPGSYRFEVLATNYTFNLYRVDVGLPGSTKPVKAYLTQYGMAWDEKGPAAPYPLKISAREKVNYFTEREGFNLIAMFSNPMMLMMLFSVGIMFVLPKLTENMDPQALEEAQRQSSKATNPAAELPDISQSLANMFAPKSNAGSSSGSAKQRKK